jgi:hypothetical protein
MPYVYEVSFDLPPDRMADIEIGHSLERLVGYMKTRLPSQRGFVYTHAVYSVDDPDAIRVVVRSEWSDWSDVKLHKQSELLEDSLFQEFEPHIAKEDITIRTYAEVGSGPLSAKR